MIIDMHTHAGRPNRVGPVDRSVLATMAPGGVAAAVVSAIADLPMIRRNPQTKRLEKVRDPEPGECLAAVRRLPGELRGHRHPHRPRAGRDPRGRRPGGIGVADPALVLAVEGCDFLEGDLDRLDALEARGVRSIQLTHYLVNETGDIQTAPPVHGGLTPFGAEAVRRMNRLGIIVDVAHCSEATVKGVAAATTQPILCTHANLKEPGHPDGDHPRYLSPDYARMVHGHRRRHRCLDRRAVGGKAARPDPPPVPPDRRGRHRPCRHRHRPARRRGEDRVAGFLAPPGDRGGVARTAA